MAMTLYTCPAKTMGASAPGPLGHPCGKAGKALDRAGHVYELKTAPGFKRLPWTRKGKRDEIRKLSGQEDVPILVLDDGSVVTGSLEIISWAQGHPAAG